MALESFYGGKQGVSPVIKASFEYVSTKDPAYTARLDRQTKLTKTEAYRLRAAGKRKETGELYKPNDEVTWNADLLASLTMDECFKDVNYTDVWYGELCIIDTQNKLNPNNGKIFRRTLKRYQNPNTEGITDVDALYAEYIGQIVGPSGGVPNLDLGSLNDERKKAIGKLPTFDTDPTVDETHPIDNTNWDYAYPTEQDNGEFLITTEKPTSIDDIALLKMSDGKNIEIVPGKDGNTYNDTIEYTWCNVRRNLDNSNENSALIYLGFKIPYSWFDINRKEIPYWDTRSNLLVHTQKGTDNKEHPFYHNLHFYIPRGARGIGPEEIFIVGKDGKSKPETLYDFDAIQYNIETDTYSVDNNKQKDPTELGLTYWVAKWRLYNPKMGNTEPISVYQYLGAYKDVNSISVDTNRFLSDGKTINQNYGQMYVTYSNSGQAVKINNKLPLPESISYNNDGTLTFTMVGNKKITTDGKFKEIESIENDSNDTNKLIIKYTNGDTQFVDIPLPTDINTNDIEINTNSGNNYSANKTVFKEIMLTNINDSDNNTNNDTPLKEFWNSTM